MIPSGRERGVSDVVGYVLLIGLVTAGIASVLLLGGSAVSEIEGDAAAESGETSLGQAERRVAALSGTRVNASTFQLRGVNPGQVDVRGNDTAGYINLSVSGGACSATLPLSAVVYEREDGGTTALQAGGRFATSPGGDSSVVVSPPALSANNGTIDVTTDDLSGFVDDREVVVRKNATISERRSARLDAQLLNGTACRRPTSASITVRSAYYDAWADHLEDETGVAATTDDSAETATVTLPQSWLPRRANDSANRVVNLSDDSAATVTSDGSPTGAPSYVTSSTENNITVNKGVNNTYTTVALPLGNGTQSSRVETVSSAVYRQPVDVVFVIDESGSMGDGDDGSWRFFCCKPDEQRKIAAARDAARNFVGQINTSTDRVAFTGFDDRGRFDPVDGTNSYYTSDPSRANNTIDDYGYGGQTAMEEGLKKANAVHDFESRSGSQKVIILLGDGANSPSVGSDDDTRQQAYRAATNNVTIYTVGFGNDADEDLLQDVANATGGQYRSADDADELNAVFQEIFTEITSSRAIVHRSTTANMTVGGDTVRPQLGYQNPDVNRINGTYDINDPEYRGGFEFSARAGDGNLIDVTAVSYGCESGAYEVTDTFVYNSTNNQTFRRARCTSVDNSTRQDVEPDETTIYLDGASVSSFPTDDEQWYQEDLVNDTLEGYVDGDELDLESNEAVVVFRYDTPETTSRIVMLYQIGLSEQETVVDVFDARTLNATVGSG